MLSFAVTPGVGGRSLAGLREVKRVRVPGQVWSEPQDRLRGGKRWHAKGRGSRGAARAGPRVWGPSPHCGSPQRGSTGTIDGGRSRQGRAVGAWRVSPSRSGAGVHTHIHRSRNSLFSPLRRTQKTQDHTDFWSNDRPALAPPSRDRGRRLGGGGVTGVWQGWVRGGIREDGGPACSAGDGSDGARSGRLPVSVVWTLLP